MDEHALKSFEERIKILEGKVERLYMATARGAHPYEGEHYSIADYAKRKIEVEGDRLINVAVARRQYEKLKDEMQILLEDYGPDIGESNASKTSPY